MRLTFWFLVASFVALGSHTVTEPDAEQRRLCIEVMAKNLTDLELAQLVNKTFAPRRGDTILFVTDLPKNEAEANPFWTDRIDMVKDWAKRTARLFPINPVSTLVFESTGRNNGVLPAVGHLFRGTQRIPYSYDKVRTASVPLQLEVAAANIVFGLTEWSITGLLRGISEANKYSRDFQAASMPGFYRGMLDGLGIDYAHVQKLSARMQTFLAAAHQAKMTFEAKVDGKFQTYVLNVDLSGGVAECEGGVTHNLRGQNRVTNLPAGEAWKVPNETTQSGTEGFMPVQFSPDGEVILLELKHNRVVRIVTDGPDSRAFRANIRRDSLHGNLAEFGAGVLKPFGLEPPRIGPPAFPVSNTLFTEKLFIHLAFGVSLHLKGSVGAQHFTDPAMVHHKDHVYTSASQPLVKLKTVILVGESGQKIILVTNGDYSPFVLAD